MSELLRYDPAKRLTSGRCLQHQYLSEVASRNDSIPYHQWIHSSDLLHYRYTTNLCCIRLGECRIGAGDVIQGYPNVLFGVNRYSLSVVNGIFIGLLASFIQSLGLTIQRKSHVLNQQLPEHEQRVEHRRPCVNFSICCGPQFTKCCMFSALNPLFWTLNSLWLLGFTIFISSNILGSLVQIASLPVVILAPLGAVSLLWNAFFARMLLGDVFSPWMILGTLLIAGGAVLIAVFGIVPEPTHSLEDLLALFRRPPFVAYFSTLGSVVFVALVVGASIRRTRLLLAISYASFSGILSGMCLIFAKSGVELLVLSLRGHFQFWRWESWVLVLGLVVFALLQLWYLHKALVLADPTLVCPCTCHHYKRREDLILIVKDFSGVLFLQYIFDRQWSRILRPVLHDPAPTSRPVSLGMSVLLSGVWVVSFQSSDDAAEDSDWSDGEVSSVSDVEAVSSPRQSQPSTRVDDYIEESDGEDADALAERLVKSESNIAEIAPSLDHATATQRLGLGRPPRPVSSLREGALPSYCPQYALCDLFSCETVIRHCTTFSRYLQSVKSTS
ncbi:cyclin-dependent protein kinase [Salix suchowensis]|nr:cyclin-dependent protein kinase [Salix suchowensis]